MAQQNRDTDYWDHYVYWYEAWLKHSPYKHLVWQRLLPLLADKKSFLDIGAGTGVFAVAATEIVPRVCCIEISRKMRERICERAASQGKNISCLAADWEKTVPEQIGEYDVVLAAHSFYQMEDIPAAFRKMLAVTGKELMIVTNANHLPGKYYSIREQLNRYGIVCKKSRITPRYDEVVSFLAAIGVDPKVEVIEYNDGHYYNNPDEAVTHVLLRLGIHDGARPIVSKVLSEHLAVVNNKFYLAEPAKMAVLVCRKE